MCPADQASFIVSSVVYRILSPDIYFGKTVRPMYISFNSGCGWVTGDRNNKHYINGNLFWLCRISRKFLLASVYYSPVYQYCLSNFREYSLRWLLSTFSFRCEPFTLCHSERSEESHIAQDKLRVAISEIPPTTEILRSLHFLRMTGAGTDVLRSLRSLRMTKVKDSIRMTGAGTEIATGLRPSR